MVFYQGTVEATSVLLLDNSACNRILPNKYLLKQYRQVHLEYYQVQRSPKLLFLSSLFLCFQKECSHFNHRNSERQLMSPILYLSPL